MRGSVQLCLLAGVFSGLLLLAGCGSESAPADLGATTRPAAMSANMPFMAECLVCKYNADLACVAIKPDKDTPTLQYHGQTYYFCSRECQEKFAKHPEKYLSK
jgi:YHS domain-containing protein